MGETAAIHDPNDHSPQVSPVPSMGSEVSGPAGRALLRWRLVPVTMLHLCGGFLIFVATLSTLHMIVWSIIFHCRGCDVRFAWIADVLRGALVAAVLGTLATCAARDLWRRQWLRGSIELASAVALYAAFVAIGGRLIVI